MKIVSLLPSCTEIVYSLGLGDSLYGVSHECDFPEEAKTKTVLTKSKINSNKRSDQIDNEIINIVKDGLSVYDINIEKLREINPDIILTQDQCEVCAVSLQDVENSVKDIIGETKIISVNPKSLQDIFSDITKIGKETNKLDKVNILISELSRRVEFIRNKAKYLDRPSICCVEWIKPIMLAGNWVPELVDIVGGTNFGSEKEKHSKKISWQDFLNLNPDIITIMPCGFKLEQTIKDIDLICKNKEWGQLKAVKSKRVYIIDGNAYFNRPGPRIIDSLEILAEIIHPETFKFNYKKEDFVRFHY